MSQLVPGKLYFLYRRVRPPWDRVLHYSIIPGQFPELNGERLGELQEGEVFLLSEVDRQDVYLAYFKIIFRDVIGYIYIGVDYVNDTFIEVTEDMLEAPSSVDDQGR